MAPQKTRMLLAGVTGVAVGSAAMSGYAASRLTESSVLSAAAFSATLSWWWFRVVGGAEGLSRAVHTGATSLRHPFSTGDVKADHVRVVFVSDTHMRHSHLVGKLPPGDVLVHCGDMTMDGTLEELRGVAAWFKSMAKDFEAIVAIPGNHDYCLEPASSDFQAARAELATCCTLLMDSEVVVCGLRIYGTPWTPPIPRRKPMAFQLSDLTSKWAQIPDGIDILVSHGPPRGRLDRIILGYNVGCPDLRATVERVRPSIVAFGHIHEAYGTELHDGIVYINAATANLLYEPTHRVPVYDVPKL